MTEPFFSFYKKKFNLTAWLMLSPANVTTTLIWSDDEVELQPEKLRYVCA